MTITAGAGGVNLTAQLTLVRLVSLATNPNSVGPGEPSTGILTFSGPLPVAAVVNLSSANVQLVRVPTAVTVLAGSVTFNFAITTIPVPGEISTTVNIMGSLAGANVTGPLQLIRIG